MAALGVFFPRTLVPVAEVPKKATVIEKVCPLNLHNGDIIFVRGRDDKWFKMRMGALILTWGYVKRHADFLNQAGQTTADFDLTHDVEIATGQYFPKMLGAEFRIETVAEIKLLRRPCEILSLRAVSEEDLKRGNCLKAYLDNDQVVNMEVELCEPILVMNVLPHPDGYDYEVELSKLEVGKPLEVTIRRCAGWVQVFRDKEIILLLNTVDRSCKLGDFPLEVNDRIACTLDNKGQVCFNLVKQIAPDLWEAVMSHFGYHDEGFRFPVVIKPQNFGYLGGITIQTTAPVQKIELTKLV